jgi:two-component system sensor histidine kinase QseC
LYDARAIENETHPPFAFRVISLRTSIRRRLLFTLLLTISLVSGVTLMLSYYDAHHEVQELFDAQLAQSAKVLQALLLPELLQGNPERLQPLLHISDDLPVVLEGEGEAGAYGHEYERKLAFQVWSNEKSLMLKSASAPEEPLSVAGLEAHNRGYSDEYVQGSLWRVFKLWDKHERFLIQVAERYDVREELTNDISNRLIAPAFLALPILGIMIWIGVGRGLSPVQHVADEVTRRDPHNLQPMEVGPVPMEIRPLVTELNELFEQLQHAFERERRFTDDAAHELRTPLASLKTQAQVALRASDESQKQQALKQVISGVDRAAHLLEQMLTLARINPESNELKQEEIFLHALAADVIAQIAPAALNKKIVLALTGDQHAVVRAHATSLSVLISNLVDNAVRYTPQGGEVNVDVSNQGRKTVLTVSDTGPGISAKLQQRVFDRFYRVMGNHTQGCGLGLAIVKQIADLFDITVELKNNDPGPGLSAKVTFHR